MTTTTARSPEASTLDANVAVVRRVYIDALSEGRLEVLDEIVAPDFVGAFGRTGPEALRGVLSELRAAIPDIRYTIDDVVAQGDRVAVRWSWTGTHEGPFRGLPASGNHVDDQGMTFYRVRDGKIVATWLETDRLGFLQQIGVLPADIQDIARLRPPS